MSLFPVTNKKRPQEQLLHNCREGDDNFELCYICYVINIKSLISLWDFNKGGFQGHIYNQEIIRPWSWPTGCVLYEAKRVSLYLTLFLFDRTDLDSLGQAWFEL